MVEALIGSTMACSHKLLHPLIFLIRLNYKPVNDLIYKKEVFEDDILMDTKYIEDLTKRNYKKDETIKYLY